MSSPPNSPALPCVVTTPHSKHDTSQPKIVPKPCPSSLTTSDLANDDQRKFQLLGGSSSFALKLFKSSGPVRTVITDSSGRETTLTNSAVCRVFSILDITLHIVRFLLPKKLSANPSARFKNINYFGQTCTAIYPSAMSVMYRSVYHLPAVWGVLLDGEGILTYTQISTITVDPKLFLFFLKIGYQQPGVSVTGEELASYKLRRFFFICSRVQEAWASTSVLSPEILTYLQQLLPPGREFIFPAMKKLTWIEVDGSQPNISRRTLPITIPGFNAFRSTGLRWVELELHDMTMPLCAALLDALFYLRIKGLVDRYLRNFPSLYAFNITICRPYESTNEFSRRILDNLHYVVLKSSPPIITHDIPMPCLTLPYCDREWLTSAHKENITIDVVTPSGLAVVVTPEEQDHVSNECYVLCSLSLGSARSFALSYRTNMMPARIPFKHEILLVLRPLIQKKHWRDIILYLDSVEMYLFPNDLTHMCEAWRHLRHLDLRFKVLHRYYTDVPTITTVQTLTLTCPFLEYLYLPELNTTGFRNNDGPVGAYGLHTLSSSVLYSDEHEAGEVAAALLDSYPTLVKVRTDTSATEWTPIAKALNAHRFEAYRAQHWTNARGGDNDHIIRVVRELTLV